MDGIEIGTGNTGRKERGQELPAELVFFMAGVFGLLLFLHSLDGVRTHMLMVFSLAGLLGGALWLSWNRNRGLFYLLLSVTLPAGILYACLLRDTLRLQIGGLLDRLASGTGWRAGGYHADSASACRSSDHRSFFVGMCDGEAWNLPVSYRAVLCWCCRCFRSGRRTRHRLRVYALCGSSAMH